VTENWIAPWLDEEKLLPGQDWDVEIEEAVHKSNVILVCLSSSSVTKEGYVQREIRFALDSADLRPEGTVLIIPIRLEECSVPRRLMSWQWLDYFPVNRRRESYERLLQSLKLRAKFLGIKIT
jgi:hypothetical protein